jgi:molybdopterin-containing oxidoreductase family iron-sulfur binding subunit
VEGNPRHPASLGATDVFGEADVLSLYDPDRSRTVLRNGEIASWEIFLTALTPELEHLRSSQGRGFRLLTSRVTSPTLLRQIDELLAIFPQARWHAYDPLEDASERAGAVIAFGRPLQALPRLELADVIVAFDADPLGAGPDQIRNGAGWIMHRNASAALEGFSRLHVIESVPTLSGSKADRRLAAAPHEIHNAALRLANAFGAGLPELELMPETATFVATAARDLRDAQHGLVLAGRTMGPELHALAHWINARLNAPIDLIEPIDQIPGRRAASLSQLAADLEANEVDVLAMLGTNPVYEAPSYASWADLIKKSRLRIHFGRYAEETAAACNWHVPASHLLESWSDLRATDGTVSLVQPLIQPLYGTRTAHELIAALSGVIAPSSYELVRQTWSAAGIADFEQWWRQALHDGVITGTTARGAAVAPPPVPQIAPQRPPEGMTLVLSPDPCIWDGTYANNAWLQECPKPLTKEVWGNALALGPADARRLGATDGDVIAIEAHRQRIESPIVVVQGMAPQVASLTLGYGRTHAGAIGNNIGANAYVLRTAKSPWLVPAAKVLDTGKRRELLLTQNYVRLSGRTDDLFPLITTAELADGKSVRHATGPFPSFNPDSAFNGLAWAMVIDTHACIGCNACVIACQSENNVPVVGPEEIARGRDMHWLRVDIYDRGTEQAPLPGFQPVPCMHCEKAPCEPVCPVAASVHDHEGSTCRSIIAA